MKRQVLMLTVGGVCLLTIGWWLGKNSSSPVQTKPAPLSYRHQDNSENQDSAKINDQQLEQLEHDLESARRQLAEQGSIIREHSLGREVRSIDEMLALFPAKYPQGDWTPSETDLEDCWFETVDGLRLHGWYLPHENPKAVVLYSHGNAGNVTHRMAVATRINKQLRCSVFVFDYRGYGRSEGVPTIDGILHDGRAARDYLATRERIAAEDIVLMGRSLGAAVVVQLASELGARGLVLESAFSSLRSVASRHYPKLLVNLLVADRLDSVSAIAKYKGPLLQSHGDADQTIPYSLGLELFNSANRPKTFVRIPRGDHNDPQTNEYYGQLKSFIKSLPK